MNRRGPFKARGRRGPSGRERRVMAPGRPRRAARADLARRFASESVRNCRSAPTAASTWRPVRGRWRGLPPIC